MKGVEGGKSIQEYLASFSQCPNTPLPGRLDTGSILEIQYEIR